MKATTTTLTLCLALTFAAGSAYAGPCTERLAELEKNLAETDAGSGPTQAAPADTAAPDAGVPQAGEAPGTEATAGMNATVGNRAASPGDVRAQTTGEPTAAQGGASSAEQVSTALAQAREADAAGDAARCGKALDEAEKLIEG